MENKYLNDRRKTMRADGSDRRAMPRPDRKARIIGVATAFTLIAVISVIVEIVAS